MRITRFCSGLIAMSCRSLRLPRFWKRKIKRRKERQDSHHDHQEDHLDHLLFVFVGFRSIFLILLQSSSRLLDCLAVSLLWSRMEIIILKNKHHHNLFVIANHVIIRYSQTSNQRKPTWSLRAHLIFENVAEAEFVHKFPNQAVLWGALGDHHHNSND